LAGGGRTSSVKANGFVQAVFVAAFLVAMPAAAQSWVRVLTRDAMRRPVPGPPTTTKVLFVLAPFPTYCSNDKLFVTRDGNVFDIAFPILDGCLSGTPPPRGEGGYFGYLPAGTYTARRVLIHENGEREITATLTFEVLEAGPPLDIPALSTITLSILAIFLIAIAVKHIA
jgi:hypothetical protein